MATCSWDKNHTFSAWTCGPWCGDFPNRRSTTWRIYSKSKWLILKNHRFPVESVEFPQQIQESHHLDLGPCPRPWDAASGAERPCRGTSTGGGSRLHSWEAQAPNCGGWGWLHQRWPIHLASAQGFWGDWGVRWRQRNSLLHRLWWKNNFHIN